MKKLILFSLLFVAGHGIVAIPGVAIPEATGLETTSLNVSASSIQMLNEDTVFPLEPIFMMPPGPIPHCGDPCFEPGRERGCVDTSGPHWAKTPCVCQGGVWTC